MGCYAEIKGNIGITVAEDVDIEGYKKEISDILWQEVGLDSDLTYLGYPNDLIGSVWTEGNYYEHYLEDKLKKLYQRLPDIVIDLERHGDMSPEDIQWYRGGKGKIYKQKAELKRVPDGVIEL